ncbi:MAG: HAD family hydrolase [Paracoccaceae bacterium]
MLRPQAVIFDIGNVLITWNPEAFYDARIGADRRQRFMAEVPIHAANLAVDAGAPFRDTIYGLAEAHPDWATEIRWWHDDWLAMVDPVIEGSVTLLRALKAKGVPVFALTNFGRETFDIALARFDFLREFDRAYVSGHMEVIKPDPAIYAAVEKDCGIEPQALLFADDRPENIDAARARGWGGHLFDGPEGWARRLVDEGLLTAREAGI